MPMAMNMPKPTFRLVADTAKIAVLRRVRRNSLSLKSSAKFSKPTYSGSEKKSQSKKDMPKPEIVGMRKKTRKLKQRGQNEEITGKRLADRRGDSNCGKPVAAEERTCLVC